MPVQRRPFSAGFVQVVLAALICFSFGTLDTSVTTALTVFARYGLPAPLLVAQYVRVYLFSGLLLTGIGSLCFVGLEMRKAYGRWMAVALTAMALISTVVDHPNPFRYYPPSHPGPISYLEIKPEEVSGAILGQLGFEVFLLTLTYQLAFGWKARAYFKGPPPS